MADGKWITDLTAKTPLVDAARRVLAIRLEVVRDWLGLALREPEKDVEHVHQLRVGTRRAGAAIEIFALCLPDKIYTAARKQLRRLRRAAGEARDWDVFLENLHEYMEPSKRRQRPCLDFLSGYALSQRVTAQAHLQAACPDYPFAFERLLADTVAAVHRPHYNPGTRTLLDLAGPLLFSLVRDFDLAAAGDLTDYERLHRVRILGKRLRYAMELFADCFGPAFREELYPAVEEMQEILGRANDSYVTSQRLAFLRDRIKASLPDDWNRLKPGIEGLLAYHHKRLPEERERFLEWLKHWQQAGGEVAFLKLRRTFEPAAS
jgi:CHAD domain-containing protein